MLTTAIPDSYCSELSSQMICSNSTVSLTALNLSILNDPLQTIQRFSGCGGALEAKVFETFATNSESNFCGDRWTGSLLSQDFNLAHSFHISASNNHDFEADVAGTVGVWADELADDLFNVSIDSSSFLLDDIGIQPGNYWDQTYLFDSKFDFEITPELLTSTSIIEQPWDANAATFVSTLTDSGISNFEFDLSSLSTGIQYLQGDFGANTFRIGTTVPGTVISGNGNLHFGFGGRDSIDLSYMLSTSVQMNLVGINGTGFAFNPGNGIRVFDALRFSDGRQVLFEGIDSIHFADRTINLSVTPNDPMFSQQWNLHMMGVHNAWRMTTGSSNVLVGVQDTGLSINNFGYVHPEIRNTTWLSNGQGVDDTWNDHGTLVQGVISAASNNGIGMSGINWNSRVYNIDVLGQEQGDLDLATATQVMINDARLNGQRLVINMSLGTATFGINTDFNFEQIVRANPDTLFVIAAGNQGNLGRSGIASPAFLAHNYDNVIAVGAAWGSQDYYSNSRIPGSRINYSNWWGSQYGEGLTLMGPSEVIAPSSQIGANGMVEFTFESKFNGTSAAAPNVAGVASLVLSANNRLTAGQVKQILAQTATDVGIPGHDLLTGHGFVNADAAVRRAIALA